MGKEYFITVFQKGDVVRKREKISREDLTAEVLKILESLLKENIVGFYVGVGNGKE